MTSDDPFDRVENLLAEVKPYLIEHLDFLGADPVAIEAQRLAVEIADTLGTAPDFAQPVMICVPGSACAFYPSEIARRLIRQVSAGVAPAAAVDWVRRVLRTERASGETVMPLWGVEVTETVRLTSAIELADISAVEGVQVQMIRERVEHGPSMTGGFSEMPRCALRMRIDQFPPLARGNTPDENETPAIDHATKLDEVRLALSAIGPSAPAAAGRWFRFDDEDLERAFLHRAVTSPHHEIIPAPFTESVRIDADLARKMIPAYLALEGPVRDRIRRSLHRVNQAVRRRDPGDKALELAIALESLLTEDSTENTYKVGLRTALLLGGERAKRIRSRGVARALYEVRSLVVHTGNTPQKVKVVKGLEKVPTADLVKEAASVVAAVVREIAIRGKIPDWADLEIGSTQNGPG